MFFCCQQVQAYERYNDGCVECHGAFTSDASPKGTVFPEDSKHEMHRGATYMNTECNLCHTSGDQKDPFIGFSNGTDNNNGLVCTGCHVAAGLRTHHVTNNVVDSFGDSCADCHVIPPSDPEGTNPPYYGTPDTNCDNAANDRLLANADENWTIGDLLGLDNDGDNLYDMADFDCGPPYKVLSIQIVGSDVQIVWESVGGRRDVIQSSPDLAAAFTDAVTPVDVPGVGVQTMQQTVTSGATDLKHFFIIKDAPLVP